jgi:DNA-binding MarR family transcriptional regulator
MRIQMAATRDELIERVMRAQYQATQSMLLLAEPIWLDLDLTLQQLKSLMVITASGSMPVSRLAELLHLQRSATSTLVDHLVHLGLFARAEDRDDRRRTLVDLTPSGREMVTRLRQGREDLMRAALEQLTDEDLHTTIRVLRTIAEYAATATADTTTASLR